MLQHLVEVRQVVLRYYPGGGPTQAQTEAKGGNINRIKLSRVLYQSLFVFIQQFFVCNIQFFAEHFATEPLFALDLILPSWLLQISAVSPLA